jgi:hypothetical protein
MALNRRTGYVMVSQFWYETPTRVLVSYRDGQKGSTGTAKEQCQLGWEKRSDKVDERS